ncbi:MAG: methyltransferase domain-containing protein [Candidatus Methylumidiphilus sp.]
MNTPEGDDFTVRQLRELEYHREYAKKHRHLIEQPTDYEVVFADARRWWNPYWALYSYLRDLGLQGKSVLVIGCGFGEDALRVAKLGAHVSAFDLSPESIEIARERANRDSLAIDFRVAPAEKLPYEDGLFDVVLAHDVLHHCDVVPTVAEMRRVIKAGGLLVVSEVYSHSLTETVRRSNLVEGVLYPRMKRLIYGSCEPYITADERKMSEHDMRLVMAPMTKVLHKAYFNFLVRRLLPEEVWISKMDCLFMRWFPWLGPFLGGRILVAGTVGKT